MLRVAEVPGPPNPQTGEPTMATNPEYKKAMEEAKRVAKESGHWIEEEFKKQKLLDKLVHMILLTAKHGVSFIQIWPDSVNEELSSMVCDAFDVYTLGNITELDDEPFLVKTRPRRISEIKADERYELEQVSKINPDNRYASSDIKEAYAKARYGGFGNPDQAATVIEKEAFIKEYLNSENMGIIARQKNGDQILEKRKEGDPIIRQVFAAGNITLKDSYLNLPSYPLIDLRFEPGPMYQVPLIERFIPANKSYDLVVSRVERILHTMVTGSWSVKTGEPSEPNNSAAGQIFKYNVTPPVQNPIAGIPPFVFNFMQLLESIIEEQGVTTTALGKIPKGVKAASAIESLKESEYANLSIMMSQVKGTVQRIAEKMLDYADDYFTNPQTVYYLEKGEPQYFDIIGDTALRKRKELNITDDQGQPEQINATPIKRDYRVEIEIESSLAYTKEVRKQSARELGDYLIQMAQLEIVPMQVVMIFIEKVLEQYEFGSTEEIMDAFEAAKNEPTMTDTNIQAVKVAMAEVIKDLQGTSAFPNEDQRIAETKVGVAEAAKDLQGTGEAKPPTSTPPQGGVRQL